MANKPISINPPPRDRRCECCGKHISMLKDFGGKGVKGAKLVKTFRGTIGASWECRDCICLDEKEYYKVMNGNRGKPIIKFRKGMYITFNVNGIKWYMKIKEVINLHLPNDEKQIWGDYACGVLGKEIHIKNKCFISRGYKDFFKMTKEEKRFFESQKVLDLLK